MFGLPLHAIARVLTWLGVIVLLLASLIYLMRWLRAKSDDEAAASGDLLTSFRDIHSKGQLSDDEYRAIRSRLAAKMQGELRRDEDRS